jgi:hypothetical protein
VVLEFELRALCRHATTWATLPALFYIEYFQVRVLGTICLGWPRTTILLISASQVARIAEVSHWCPADMLLLFFKYQQINMLAYHVPHILLTVPSLRACLIFKDFIHFPKDLFKSSNIQLFPFLKNLSCCHPSCFCKFFWTGRAPSDPQSLLIRFSNIVFFDFMNFAVGLSWTCVILLHLSPMLTRARWDRHLLSEGRMYEWALFF